VLLSNFFTSAKLHLPTLQVRRMVWRRVLLSLKTQGNTELYEYVYTERQIIPMYHVSLMNNRYTFRNIY